MYEFIKICNITDMFWHVLNSELKHTLTLSSLKSSPSMMSTLKDIAALYSPMKSDHVAFNEQVRRVKPRPEQLLPVKENAIHAGPNRALLRLISPNSSPYYFNFD